jgi:curved DNA-binding protein CbpA
VVAASRGGGIGDAAGRGRALLGIGAGATIDDIRAAHRRLIAKVHPDAGGSAGLATRVNAARDALIAELNGRSRLS